MKLPVTLLFAMLACAAQAGEVDVTDVKANQSGDGNWRFDVTLRHDDAGWDHYANKWEVVGPDGTVLATRELLHPHVDEQPFTRSLGGVKIPAGIKQVTVRGSDLVHGLGGVALPVSMD